MGSSPNLVGREDKEPGYQLKPYMYRLIKHYNYLFRCIAQGDSVTFESLWLDIHQYLEHGQLMYFLLQLSTDVEDLIKFCLFTDTPRGHLMNDAPFKRKNN